MQNRPPFHTGGQLSVEDQFSLWDNSPQHTYHLWDKLVSQVGGGMKEERERQSEKLRSVF